MTSSELSDLRRRLRWLIVLGDEQNVTAAAAVLGMAQPSLSRALGRVERELGVTLFDRHGRSIQLNAAGTAYLEHLRIADAQIAAGELAAQRIAGHPAPPLRLGFLHSFGTWLVPALLRAGGGTTDRHILRQDAAGAIAGAVADGDLDVGIVSPRPGHANLRWQLLMHQQLHVLVPVGSRLADRADISIDELAGEPQIVMETGFGMRTILDSLCSAAGFRPRIAIECQDLTTVSALVGAGLGSALVPTQDGADVPGSVAVALRTDSPAVAGREVGVVWRRDSGPVAEAFVERARQWAAASRG